MKAYVGQTRSATLIAELAAHGIGECVSRGELPPRRSAWFYDNGAFGDFKAGRPFNVTQYVRDLRRIAMWPMVRPDFIVLPDLVAGGLASLAESSDWLEWTDATGAPLYLAVQDGMTPADLPAELLERVAGLFVGGSLPWKLETAAAWSTFAHARGLRCHVGRVGTAERVTWARAIGVDSIDSALPLWSAAKLDRFLEALER